MKKSYLLTALVGCMALSVTAQDNKFANQPANPRGSTDGATTAPGFSHPNQYLHVQATQIADNMEPVIIHQDEVDEARKKLAEFEKRTGEKPNILFFLTDDVGYMDFGFNGGGVAVGNATPNLDRLAAEGLILTSAYSTPSCTPTRATVMTGQNPLHHGLLRPPMYGEPGGLGGAETVASILKKLGYKTQGVGKWHMGEVEGSVPQDVGFDDFYGFLGVSDMYTEWRDVYFNPEIALSPERTKMLAELNFNHYNVHVTPEKGVEEVYEIDLESIKNLDQDWTRYSEEFIESNENSDQPWFLYHNTRGAHFDNYPNEDFAGKSRARNSYSDAIVEIDDTFGRLIAKLEATGQLENTFIFVGSDNGPEQEVAPYGRTPFRGGKGSTWEGGTRVPTFVYWKGMIEPRKSEGLFFYADLFNTALSLAGASGTEVNKFIPEDRYVDGIDQTAFFLADEGQSARKSIIYTMNQHLAAVRIDEFKYHMVVQLQDAIFSQGLKGGFSGAVIPETGGSVMVNLYTNPQENLGIGNRYLPIVTQMGAEVARYAKVLAKYPPNIKVAMPGSK
ncbi:sulfatase-like hydrolase/transferase [Echinicola rosea]|uniref:Arylsulfatase n=1 Tax=Echinicola rosea TaxID=1807691 RepID=A0ABQ1V6W6_9BACT|nr:sulfatase-like hydrolase/transferase [Echinicola rosea]GGF39779.1 arylsulfatase [Echinicola rosea]